VIKLQTFGAKVGEFLFKTCRKVKDSERFTEYTTKNIHFFSFENQSFNKKSDRMNAFFLKNFW